VKAILKELLVVALGLSVVAGAVFGLGDRAVLVPPPEMVVEEFVRALSLKRWSPAREHLATDLVQHTGAGALRAFVDTLEARIGPVEEVKGKPFFGGDEAAEAEAEITTADGSRATLRLPLRREHGLWKIARLELQGLRQE
jgi:hypothetical protein